MGLAIDYKQLAGEMLQQVATKDVPSSTPTAVYGHGAGGLFSYPGPRRPVFSAMVLPQLGLQSLLPVVGTIDTNPLADIVTGVTATSGSNPTGPCDDPKVAGTTKLCMHQFVYGRYSLQTPVIDITRVGKIVNRSDFRDYRFYGNPFDVANPNVPAGIGQAGVPQLVNNEIAKKLFEFGVAWSREFARQMYNGTPTNNTAANGYMEFYGLESLVNTGYRDAVTNVTCPAADSIVRDWGDTNIYLNPTGIVSMIRNVYRNLQYLAARAGLQPVQWVLSMKFDLFYALTDIWPYRPVVVSGIQQRVDAFDAVKVRQNMRGDLYNRTGQYLIIDGQEVPVVIDDAVPETVNAGETFTTDIYFIPLRVLSNRQGAGMPVTFIEYFDYDNSPDAAQHAAQYFAPADSYYTSDNGRWLWHKKPPNNWCTQLMAIMEPRLMLLTPYLAARITNVRYDASGEHAREWEPGTSYYKDGGNQSGNNYQYPSFYPPTT